jgi:pentatricopeptide repeat protein
LKYPPIEDHGIVGDMHSAALVCLDGTVDWCCLPDFDSPSVFASLLDHEKGGCFQIVPTEESRKRQIYLPDTNVLVSRFLRNDGAGEVTDFMPVRRRHGADESGSAEIVRIVACVRGRVRFRLRCKPAYDFARVRHELSIEPRGAVFRTPDVTFALVSPIPLERSGDEATAEFCVAAGEKLTFVFRQTGPEVSESVLAWGRDYEEELRHTVEYWRNWLAKGTYHGRWRSMVERSALTLKLLTYGPTGAILAAPTTSLPEGIGGVRNWDYRFCWIRDSAFTIHAFLRLGHTEEAARFMQWLQDRVQTDDTKEPLQIMYRVDGRAELAEEELGHLDGYQGSRPVRIGNGAAAQLQLDIYGELIDSIYLYSKHVEPVSYDVWRSLRRMFAWVAENWRRPDDGIWEVRGGRQHFVYSKLQCWVALDRGFRMADQHGLPIDRERLLQARDSIYEAVMEEGWSNQRQSFVQSLGGEALDASNLLMPVVQFIGPRDPRMLATLDRTMEDLVVDSLVWRYRIGHAADDGVPGHEASFCVCTFWLVEALAKAGRVEEARFIFEKMLAYGNHLGLFSEEIGFRGEALGNFPQAYTHLSLISAAMSLDRHLDERK